MEAAIDQFIRPPAGVLQEPELVSQAPVISAQPLFLHKISAGFPSPAADYIEDGLDLNEFLVKNKAASFIFNVTGDSMRDAGILHGDKVIVDRSINPVHGHIIVAVIDAEYTLKRLYCLHGRVELHPDNPAYRPIRLTEGHELQVWGVVTGIIRKYSV